MKEENNKQLLPHCVLGARLSPYACPRSLGVGDRV